MKYKIKHENKVLQILGVVLTFFTFFLIVIGILNEAMFWAMIASLALTVIIAVLCFIDKGVGASIVIRDRTITINHLFVRKKIDVDDIDSVDMEDIKRHRRGAGVYIDYRRKMTILLNSGKKIVLTDNASEVNGIAGFVTGERDEKPDEEIPLCQAYNEIFDLMN
ncbi:MAG: hypothetical protein K5665_07560 [Saccharofermentans sp.]|nr:hypothetical protein [Saccharofermentans sp.]